MARELQRWQFSLGSIVSFTALCSLVAFMFVNAGRSLAIDLLVFLLTIYSLKLFIRFYRVSIWAAIVIYGAFLVSVVCFIYPATKPGDVDLSKGTAVALIAFQIFTVPTITLICDLRAAKRGPVQSWWGFAIRTLVEIMIISPIWWTLCAMGAVVFAGLM